MGNSEKISDELRDRIFMEGYELASVQSVEKILFGLLNELNEYSDRKTDCTELDIRSKVYEKWEIYFNLTHSNKFQSGGI